MEYNLSSKAYTVYIVTLLGRITKKEQNSIFNELNEQSF